MMATGGAPHRGFRKQAAASRGIPSPRIVGAHGVTVGAGSLRGILDGTALDGDARSVELPVSGSWSTTDLVTPGIAAEARGQRVVVLR